jgi:hypothetical protein
LAALTGFEPAPTLTGGAALAGYHLGHRATADLDLFFHGSDRLGHVPDELALCLRDAGCEVRTVQSGATFHRLSVTWGGETTVVDLVADPVPVVEAPAPRHPGILVDTPHEITVNKLGALLSRSELRDLEDLRALVAAGADLDRALADAPIKDGGFSPILLAWTLTQLDLRLAPRLGFDEQALADFAAWLSVKLTEEPL